MTTPTPSSTRDNLIKARALEWRIPTDHPMDFEDSSILVADGLGGKYHISEPAPINQQGTIGHLLWLAHDEFIWEPCLSIEGAKAKAEADWQARYAACAIASQEKQS